jgi:hypothetical protein
MPRDQSHDAKPSEETGNFWISVEAPRQGPRDFEKCGKWMLFSPTADHDDVWAKIRRTTEAGELGCAAKAATARPNGLQTSSRALVTCVYTYDFEDLDDVRRVLVALRRLGFGGRLSYKTDSDTLQGRYGRGVATYVSQPGSLDFEDRRVGQR